MWLRGIPVWSANHASAHHQIRHRWRQRPSNQQTPPPTPSITRSANASLHKRSEQLRVSEARAQEKGRIIVALQVMVTLITTTIHDPAISRLKCKFG